ncbi:MAG: DUF3108 domain-containing protein [Candidatus Omnitrophica bacterium]|nr:DUF3108 domain-containing protein [Candidatus Omnitrophota bacterium]
MTRRWQFVGLGLWLVWPLAVACAAPAAFEKAPAAPDRPLQVGERLTFQGRWLGIPVGGGWIEVKELTDLNGRAVYHIEAQGYSNELLSTFYPVKDVLHSYLDAATLQPLRFEKKQREGHYRADEVVTFDYDRLVATYRSLLNGSVKEIPIGPDTHDLISSFYRLRTEPVEGRGVIAMNVYSDEKVYRMELRRLGTEILELRRSVFSCLVVEPVASFRGVFVRRGRMVAYVTADQRRIPVLVKIATPWGLMMGILDEAVISRELPASADVRPPAVADHAARGAAHS